MSVRSVFVKIVLSIVMLAGLTGCGGLTYYVHDNVRSEPAGALPPVILSPGQELKVLKHSSGIMWGGYREGIAIEDPAVAEVRYGQDGSDSWSPRVYLIGLKPGTTRAVYCNRLGDRPDFSNPLGAGFRDRVFEVTVRATD